MSAQRLLLCLLLLPLVWSCAGGGGGSLFSQPDPNKHFYALQTKRAALACGPQKGDVLKIRRANIAPVYESRELTYRTGENEYKTDYYNVFLVSPRDMITEAVTEWFSGSGLFAHVVPNNSAIKPNYVLESTTTLLYGDFRAPGEPKAVLEMQFFLLQDVLADYKVIFCKQYDQEIPLKKQSPESLVAGLEQGLQAILTQLEADVAQVLGASQ